jgi:thiol:disulfide interchange protein
MDYIKDAVLKFWVMSACGLGLGVLQIVVPIFGANRMPTKFEWATACGTTLIGFLGKFVIPSGDTKSGG